MSYQHIPGDTIAAICTPPGEGGVAMIRVSGERAIEVSDRVFSGSVATYKTHTVHYGVIRDSDGNHLDDVLLTVMLAPRTYTGDDTVEISCHGGAIVTRRVLEVVLAAGARAARPGEFTFKAFMSGKLDLAQAEAVQALIHAKNEHALDAAEQHLQGSLSKRIETFQKTLTHIAAILEAWVDFPEEGIEFASMEEICGQLQQARNSMQQLEKTFHDGKIVHDGISLCLIGSPNVGKSSLMNALLDKDRAIVSEIAGTTRDIVEDDLKINGLNIRVVDTAGIREATEQIEAEGIRRSHVAMKKSDLILLVLDAGRALTDKEKHLIEELPSEKTIGVWNKIDLPDSDVEEVTLPAVVKLSALERSGLEELYEAIDTVIWDHGPPARDEVMVTNLRHKEALTASIAAVERLLKGLQEGLSPEFLTQEIRESLSRLGTIIGTDVTEDILSAIFSTFCVGK